MNNNRCKYTKKHEKKCILRFPICITKCKCIKYRKKKCFLKFPVCIECPPGHAGSPEFLEPQDNEDSLDLM